VLSPEEILAVDDHLAVCVLCRGRFNALSQIKSDGYGVIDLTDSEDKHELSYEQIEDYVDGLSAGESPELEIHIDSCRECKNRVADLLLVKASISRHLSTTVAGRDPVPDAAQLTRIASRNSAFLKSAVVIAASTMLVILIAVSIYWRAQLESERGRVRLLAEEKRESDRHWGQEISDLKARLGDSRRERQNETLEPGRNDSTLSLVDGERTIELKGGSLTGLGPASPYLSGLVKQALRSATVDTPTLEGLKGTEGTLMGGEGDSTTLTLSSPVGVVVEDDRPVFSWISASVGAIYVVTLARRGSNLSISSPPLRSTQWRCVTPLRRGAVYSWNVKATLSDGRELFAPRPPAPEAKFRVLDSFQERELERARRSSPESHLALAVLYGRAGLVTKSRRELELVVAANPDSVLAKRLLDSLGRR